MSTKTELSAERLRAEEKKKAAAEEIARDVAYHQAIVMRGTTREASTLLFRLPLAGAVSAVGRWERDNRKARAGDAMPPFSAPTAVYGGGG